MIFRPPLLPDRSGSPIPCRRYPRDTCRAGRLGGYCFGGSDWLFAWLTSARSMKPSPLMSYVANCAFTLALASASVFEMRPSPSVSSDSNDVPFPCDSDGVGCVGSGVCAMAAARGSSAAAPAINKLDAFVMMCPLLLNGVTFKRGNPRANDSRRLRRKRLAAWAFQVRELKAMQRDSRRLQCRYAIGVGANAGSL